MTGASAARLSINGDQGYATGVEVTAYSASATCFVGTGAASQTGDFLEFYSSAAAQKFAVDKDGYLYVGTTKVVGSQAAAIADASGGAIIDAEARTALNDLLAKLRTHGLIDT